jgi:hypothetical protein
MLDHDGVDLIEVRGAAAEAAPRGRELATADAMKGNQPRSLVIAVADEQCFQVFRTPNRGTKGPLADP